MILHSNQAINTCFTFTFYLHHISTRVCVHLYSQEMIEINEINDKKTEKLFDEETIYNILLRNSFTPTTTTLVFTHTNQDVCILFNLNFIIMWYFFLFSLPFALLFSFTRDDAFNWWTHKFIHALDFLISFHITKVRIPNNNKKIVKKIGWSSVCLTRIKRNNDHMIIIQSSQWMNFFFVRLYLELILFTDIRTYIFLPVGILFFLFIKNNHSVKNISFIHFFSVLSGLLDFFFVLQ